MPSIRARIKPRRSWIHKSRPTRKWEKEVVKVGKEKRQNPQFDLEFWKATNVSFPIVSNLSLNFNLVQHPSETKLSWNKKWQFGGEQAG